MEDEFEDEDNFRACIRFFFKACNCLEVQTTILHNPQRSSPSTFADFSKVYAAVRDRDIDEPPISLHYTTKTKITLPN